jgi:DME family drug/metabolite transporter
MAVGVLRLMLGGTGLVVVAAMAGSLGSLRGARRPALAMAALAVAAYQPLFFSGVARAGVALGTVVAIGSAPVLTGVLGWIRGERPTLRWSWSTALALAGVWAIARPGGAADPVGVFLALGAGASYAVFAVGAKRVLREVAPLAVMAGAFGGGAVLSIALVPWVDWTAIGSGRGALTIAWLGVVATTAAYSLYGFGLRHTPAGAAATLSLLEPVVATLLGVWLLAERPDLAAWGGIALVGLALAALAWDPERQPFTRGEASFPRRRGARS